MIQIALSGSPFSGLEIASSKFKEIGVSVFNADLILNFILNHKIDVMTEIERKIGYVPYTRNVDGNGGSFDPFKVKNDLDFDSIIDIVELDILESYDRYVRKNIKNSLYTIFASSILHERKLNIKFDVVINCFSPTSMRSETAKSQGGLSYSDFLSRSKKEISEYEKNERSDHVIHTYIGGIILDESISNIHYDVISRIKKLESYVNDRN